MRTGVGGVGGSREPRARAGDVLFLRSRAWNCSVGPRRRASCSDRAEGLVVRDLCVFQPQQITPGVYNALFCLLAYR